MRIITPKRRHRSGTILPTLEKTALFVWDPQPKSTVRISTQLPIRGLEYTKGVDQLAKSRVLKGNPIAVNGLLRPQHTTLVAQALSMLA